MLEKGKGWALEWALEVESGLEMDSRLGKVLASAYTEAAYTGAL